MSICIKMRQENRKTEKIEIERMVVLLSKNQAKPINPGEPRDLMVIIGKDYYIKTQMGYYQRLSYSND